MQPSRPAKPLGTSGTALSLYLERHFYSRPIAWPYCFNITPNWYWSLPCLPHSCLWLGLLKASAWNFSYYLLFWLHLKCFSVFLSSTRWKFHFSLTLPSWSGGSYRVLHQILELLPGLQGIKSYCSVWTASGHQKTWCVCPVLSIWGAKPSLPCSEWYRCQYEQSFQPAP